jgi:hypothetical protein
MSSNLNKRLNPRGKAVTVFLFLALFTGLTSQAGPNFCQDFFLGSGDYLRQRYIESWNANFSPDQGKNKATSAPPTQDIAVSETKFPVKNWKVDILSPKESSEKYVLVDVGLKNLESDQEILDHIYQQHLLGPNYLYPIHFVFKGEKKKSVELLERFRWGLHDAVIKIYQGTPRKQKYLDLQGLSGLMFENNLTQNSDVLGVLKAKVGSLVDWTKKQVREHTEVAIQITYSIRRIFDQPNYDKILGKVRRRHLPFMDRYPESSEKQSMMEQFEKDFAEVSVAEFNRFAKASAKVPESLEKYLLLKAIERAEARGVQVLFASTDRATKRLFEGEYHFSLYKEIPLKEIFMKANNDISEGLPEREFVLMMVIGSPEYVEFMTYLRSKVTELSHSTESFLTPL